MNYIPVKTKQNLTQKTSGKMMWNTVFLDVKNLNLPYTMIKRCSYSDKMCVFVIVRGRYQMGIFETLRRNQRFLPPSG